MILQIYAVTSVEEALQVAAMGVEHVGFVAGTYGEVPGELSFDQAAAIAAALRGRALASALTMSTDISEIARMADAVRPDIVHISSETEAVGVEALRHLRAMLAPGVRLMKAVHVAGADSIEQALAFAEVAEILLLDTKVAGMPGVGATGRTHDWSISRQIVARVGARSRVILAGGLTPENVAAAIQAVRPWGVDSNTGTNVAGDRVRKDLARVARFVERARTVHAAP